MDHHAKSSNYRGPHAVLHISQYPWTFVRSTECYRSGQIVSRLLGERFPGQHFKVCEGFGMNYGLCGPHYRDAAHSVEVNSILTWEIAQEAKLNPTRGPKWIAFHFKGERPSPDLQYCAYLEHDTKVLQLCRMDPTLLFEGAIYCDRPDERDILAVGAGRTKVAEHDADIFMDTPKRHREPEEKE